MREAAGLTHSKTMKAVNITKWRLTQIEAGEDARLSLEMLTQLVVLYSKKPARPTSIEFELE